MGALSSKIKNGKVVSVEKELMGQAKISSNDNKVLQKYMEYLNTYGFYKVKLHPVKFAENIAESKKLLEAFVKVNKPVKSNFDKNIDQIKKMESGPSIFSIMMPTMYGFYTISSIDKREKQKMQDIDIIIPKVYITEGKSDEFIEFIYKNFILELHKKKQTGSRKEYKDLLLRQALLLKNVAKDLFKKIQKRKNPSVVLLNMLGILIKSITASVLMEGATKNNPKFLSNLISNLMSDIISIIPDNKCFIETNTLKFIEITPSMCEIEKIEPEKEIVYIEKKCPAERICQEQENDEVKYIKVPDESLCNTDNTWFIISGVFITTTIIFIILYILKE